MTLLSDIFIWRLCFPYSKSLINDLNRYFYLRKISTIVFFLVKFDNYGFKCQ